MERNERPQRMLARMAELFDLPADIVAGLCHVEMLGDRQLFLEGHSGILSYGTEQIDVGAGSLILRVRGQNLTLRSMTDSEVRIFGKIDAVEYVRCGSYAEKSRQAAARQCMRVRKERVPRADAEPLLRAGHRILGRQVDRRYGAVVLRGTRRPARAAPCRRGLRGGGIYRAHGGHADATRCSSAAFCVRRCCSSTRFSSGILRSRATRPSRLRRFCMPCASTACTAERLSTRSARRISATAFCRSSRTSAGWRSTCAAVRPMCRCASACAHPSG